MPTLASPLREALKVRTAESVAGGCIHECYRVRIGADERFLKLNQAGLLDAFAAEADGLRALRAAGLRAPEPISHGTAGGKAFLLLEFLHLEGRGDFAVMGRMLAEAHHRPGPRFGWHRDNYIGSTPQANGWGDDWADFWRVRRMEPQLELATRNGFALSSEGIYSCLEAHRPAPSLLHGDLWSGNAGFTKEGPVVFDPAVYYGDREADIAMSELFGGFPPEFYAAYEQAYPLDSGYSLRKHLYNLYHLLNHLNLFGAGYLAQVERTLGFLRNVLK
ncbi:MAG TPA: fructosamine kinase family protein [Burkholderiales bacterium]|nr:fructosamine kinase family protein [Burkholderiales bacterium]